MANRELAAKVADAIENRSVPKLGFFMGAYAMSRIGIEDSNLPRRDHECESAACIAGWTLAAQGIGLVGNYHIHQMAADFLELRSSQAALLFLGNMYATDEKAVRALRHLAATGEVVMPGTV
jgi:hypothetical protein